MLRKYVVGPQFLVTQVLEKARAMYKHEGIAYKGAFLVSARQALLPYLQNGCLPEPEQEAEIMKKLVYFLVLYEDVNDLYTDEHLIMTQSDLLEQMYSMVSAMHDISRHKEIVQKKSKNIAKIDPDQFPIQRLTGELIDEYESIWDTEKKPLYKQLERQIGHTINLKDSGIDHHEAGRGVFLSCKRQRVVLPGTLLGLFPGVVCDPKVPMPETPKRAGLHPYLKRYDGYWLDYEKELPYPLPPPGSNFMDYFENFVRQNEKRGNDIHKIIQVPPEMINPYALGHFLNHPPPDTPANVSLIDFDLPYTFFPSNYGRYIPYINYREEPTKTKTYETRRGDVYRAVAIVAQTPIAHGDELFVDYIEDSRASLENVPEWLLEPPPSSPYLQKKKLTADVPFLVRLVYSYHTAKQGTKLEEFQARTTAELPQEQQEKRKKAIQERLEKVRELQQSPELKDNLLK